MSFIIGVFVGDHNANERGTPEDTREGDGEEGLRFWGLGFLAWVLSFFDSCILQLGPWIVMMMEWCTMRSTIAVVTTGSPR